MEFFIFAVSIISLLVGIFSLGVAVTESKASAYFIGFISLIIAAFSFSQLAGTLENQRQARKKLAYSYVDVEVRTEDNIDFVICDEEFINLNRKFERDFEVGDIVYQKKSYRQTIDGYIFLPTSNLVLEKDQ